MSHGYKAVGWNRQKKIYDRTLIGGVVLYLALYIGLSLVAHPNAGLETLMIRAFGTAALVLLHVILSIGPMCRFDRRWLPLLYNRRHMGVLMFMLALIHGGFSIIWYHGFGDTNPLVSVFTANRDYTGLANFPFQTLGFFALAILFLMAATSHDFWLANLTPPVWKTLHMLVYVAYALLIAHVVLGFQQAETSPVLTGLVALGFVWICAIHCLAARKEKPGDVESSKGEAESGYIEICGVEDMAEKRGITVMLAGDRVAIFKYDGKFSAISNACQHQNGPLGEGRVIDGFVTCPWHGFQYDPASGASPPPFTEKVPTFNIRVKEGRVWVDPKPNPPGTYVEPATLNGEDDAP